MWQHSVKARLKKGEIVVALSLVTPSVEAAAHAASLGFHVLWVEMEHSPITLETLRLMVLATRREDTAVFARVPVAEAWTAKRVLDQGVTGAIFPFVSSPATAARVAAACRYPPRGIRGSGAGLACASWPATGNYYDSADENIATVAMVEDRAGLESIDEIAGMRGIDVIFIGTSDLAFSLGHRGDESAPEVQAAIRKISNTAKRHRKFLGRPVTSAREARLWHRRGFQFFQIATELSLMTSGATELLGPLGIRHASSKLRPYY